MINSQKYVNNDHLLQYSLDEQLTHGMQVSNLAYGVAKQLGMDEDFCHDMAVAGMLHDIGKEQVSGFVDDYEDRLLVEEMSYVRLHATASCEILQRRGYSKRICEAVLYHHENMDGSGYPENLAGDAIPLGAKILRVCDVYAALTSDRPYRGAFEKEEAIHLMIDEIKNFDVRVFLAFQRHVHDDLEDKE